MYSKRWSIITGIRNGRKREVRKDNLLPREKYAYYSEQFSTSPSHTLPLKNLLYQLKRRIALMPESPYPCRRKLLFVYWKRKPHMEVIRMKRKALFLFTIIMAVSLSACTDNPASTVDSTGSEAAASTASIEESRSAEDASGSTELQTSSSGQVKEPSETEIVVNKPTEPSETEAQSEQITVVSQTTVPESAETARPSALETKPETPISPPLSTEPVPTPSAPPVTPSPEPTPEPQPTAPAFDVSRYVGYAKSYGSGIGLALDSFATGCWDTPIL
jgi:hypothetical protein